MNTDTMNNEARELRLNEIKALVAEVTSMTEQRKALKNEIKVLDRKIQALVIEFRADFDIK